MKRKEVDDVLGGDDMWKHADSTAGALLFVFASEVSSLIPDTASCPKCDHDRAYFYQLQIRSADEPMTTCKSPVFLSRLPDAGTNVAAVYRCASCGNQWREN